MQEKNLTLRRVWLEHQEFTKTLGRRTKPLDEALELHLRDMEENERGSRYVDGLDQYLGMFIRGREKLGVDRIGKEDVEQWFRDRREKGMVKLSNMGEPAFERQLSEQKVEHGMLIGFAGLPVCVRHRYLVQVRRQRALGNIYAIYHFHFCLRSQRRSFWSRHSPPR